MKINDQILEKHLTQAAIEQLIHDYEQAGYTVTRDAHVDRFKVDLIAKNEDKTILFEIKSGKWYTHQLEQISKLRAHIQQKKNVELRIVLVSYPETRAIEIDEIESILLDHILESGYDWSSIATHVHVESVSDVDISQIHITSSDIDIIGTALASIQLQFGSSSDIAHDDGYLDHDTVSVDFHLNIDYERGQSHVIDLVIDY